MMELSAIRAVSWIPPPLSSTMVTIIGAVTTAMTLQYKTIVSSAI